MASIPALDAIPDSTQTSFRTAIAGFYAMTILLNLCLVAQVLTVGLAYFDTPTWWQAHVWLVRGYSGLSLVLLAWVYWIPMPQRIRLLTLSLPILLGLQFLTIHGRLPLPVPLAVFHPLLGFSLFSVATTLVHRVRAVLLSDTTLEETL